RRVEGAARFPPRPPLPRTAPGRQPRRGSPPAHDCSVGGPLLWPADEPWPHCAEPHARGATRRVLSPEDIRLLRRIQAAVASRRHLGPPASRPTPEELATEKRILQGRTWPEGPVPLLPVAQLYTRDVPLPFTPPGADLLQVLWCPFDHPTHPRTAVFWRSAGTVTDILDAPPEPPAIKSQGYLPEPSVLAPERVTEYPAFGELDQKLRQELGDPIRWDGSCPAAPQESYDNDLSTSPGWKTGGWSRWSLTDPAPRSCPECGTEALPLLTVATLEWDAGSESWAPEEERTNPTPLLPGTPPANFTLIGTARGSNLQLHGCPADPSHPHIELVQ
ncbi:hypothetical protein ACFUVV_36020, partial [Streptomyces sp. NPDC057376]|uniref:hypothetical protein n=1 Tax=Streptomyces sp. NPDC057376 TaxID=3346110 RepID=UPI003632E0D9